VLDASFGTVVKPAGSPHAEAPARAAAARQGPQGLKGSGCTGAPLLDVRMPEKRPQVLHSRVQNFTIHTHRTPREEEPQARPEAEPRSTGPAGGGPARPAQPQGRAEGQKKEEPKRPVATTRTPRGRVVPPLALQGLQGSQSTPRLTSRCLTGRSTPPASAVRGPMVSALKDSAKTGMSARDCSTAQCRPSVTPRRPAPPAWPGSAARGEGANGTVSVEAAADSEAPGDATQTNATCGYVALSQLCGSNASPCAADANAAPPALRVGVDIGNATEADDHAEQHGAIRRLDSLVSRGALFLKCAQGELAAAVEGAARTEAYFAGTAQTASPGGSSGERLLGVVAEFLLAFRGAWDEVQRNEMRWAQYVGPAKVGGGQPCLSRTPSYANDQCAG